MEYKALIERLNQTYCFYRQRYVMMIGNGMQTIPHGYGDKVIQSHLEGRYALCVFSGDKATRFLSVDIDAGGKKAVRSVIDAFVELGIPRDRIYVSLSGGKGYHVDIFFCPWIYNDKAKNLYELMIWKTGLDTKKVELTPTPKDSIKIPLGVHAKKGKRCWFVDRDTMEPIESFDYLFEIEPVDYELINDVVREGNKKRWNELYAEMVCEGTGQDTTVCREIVFDDDYYNSMRLIVPGTRHETMVRIARDLRTYGAVAPQIRKALTGFYFRQDPKMIGSSEREVMNDIEDIANWAEENIPIKKYRPSPNEGIQRNIVLKLEDAEQIMRVATRSSRKIALLIYSFCRMFGASHMSYNYISETLGCSVATVKNSINDLLEHNIISRESGGCHYQYGKLVRKSNTYFIANSGGKLNEEDDPEAFVFPEKITNASVDDLYYGLILHFFNIEQLRQYLSKPELDECKRRMEGVSADGGAGAAADA